MLGVSARITVPVLSQIPILGAVFKDLYPFEIIIVFVALAAWYVMYKTRYGMNLRACGDNPHAVDAAGVDVGKVRLVAVMVSGGLSGTLPGWREFALPTRFPPTSRPAFMLDMDTWLLLL